MYEAGGAAALSVLTDNPFFGGTVGDLQAAREATALPALRKDFVIDEVQVFETRGVGADAMLLIVAAIPDDGLLADLHALALELGLSVLVEAHDEREIERALAAGARVVGINNRSLQTFAEDLEIAERLAALVPPDVVRVAESAVRSVEDARRMAAVGFDAVLVGEALVRSADAATLVARWRRSASRLVRRTRKVGPVFIKICGITTSHDALLATAVGADALGFVFAPSVRQVQPADVREIARRLPHGITTVGVFRNERPERIVTIVAKVGLHGVQLHGHEPLSEVRWIRERVPFVIQAFTAGDPALATAANGPADAVLIDSPNPGSGRVFDWTLAEGAGRRQADPRRAGSPTTTSPRRSRASDPGASTSRAASRRRRAGRTHASCVSSSRRPAPRASVSPTTTPVRGRRGRPRRRRVRRRPLPPLRLDARRLTRAPLGSAAPWHAAEHHAFRRHARDCDGRARARLHGNLTEGSRRAREADRCSGCRQIHQHPEVPPC